MIKIVTFLALLPLHICWAGWHLTEESEHLAREAAQKHPLASACAGVCDESMILGSGVFVRSNIVLTAAHVVCDSTAETERKGPYLKASGTGLSVWVDAVQAATEAEIDFDLWPVQSVFFDKGADIAFLVLDAHTESSKVAPILPSDLYTAHLKKPLYKIRQPQPSGTFDGGAVVSFIGKGHSVVVGDRKFSVDEIDAIHMGESESLCKPASDTEDGFALGQVQLSQHFSTLVSPRNIDTFYGHVSLTKPGPWSSPLPGDSGAPAILEVEGLSYVFGVVTDGSLSQEFPDDKVVTAHISSVLGLVRHTKSTWWEAFLEAALLKDE